MSRKQKLREAKELVQSTWLLREGAGMGRQVCRIPASTLFNVLLSNAATQSAGH